MTTSKIFIIIISVIAGLVSPAFGQSIEVHEYQFKKSKNQSVAAPYKKTKRQEPEFNRWEMSLGFGTVEGRIREVFSATDFQGDRFDMLGEAAYTQQTYYIESRRNFNRFFDAQLGLHLPNGQADIGQPESSSLAFINTFEDQRGTFSYLLQAGVGVTPFHIDFLEVPFMELGLDLNTLIGDNRYLGRDSVTVMFGPRVGFNLGRRVALILRSQWNPAHQFAMRSSNASLAYRW